MPLPLALVVADAIWTDPGTRKKTILGTFSVIYGQRFPFQIAQVAVYVALTDGYGKYELTLRLIDVDESREPVLEHQMGIDFPDPVSVVEGIMSLPNLVFPAAGEYRIQLLCSGELIIERRLVVMPSPEDSNA